MFGDARALEPVSASRGGRPRKCAHRHPLSTAAGTAKHRSHKQVPAAASVFGWCTWDAFYSRVSAAGIQAGLTSLAEGGVPPKLVIIDDGWQRTDVDERYRTAGGRRWLAAVQARGSAAGTCVAAPLEAPRSLPASRRTINASMPLACAAVGQLPGAACTAAAKPCWARAPRCTRWRRQRPAWPAGLTTRWAPGAAWHTTLQVAHLCWRRQEASCARGS